MILKNNYWVFPKVLSHKFCDELIDFGNKANQQIALTGKQGKNRNFEQNPLTETELNQLKQKDRNSNISWLNSLWIYKRIAPFVDMANKNAGWNWQWDFSEDLQFTRYSEGQFYGWHMDGWDEPYTENNNKKGKIRKISVTCSLNDGSEYEGGDLEFDFKNEKTPVQQKCPELRQKGSVIVFPSFIHHQVTKVTKGTRYSLVAWQLGQPWI